MKVRLIVSIAAAALLAACGPAVKEEATATAEEVAAANASLDAAMVDLAALQVKELNRRLTLPANAAENGQFFATDIAEALTRDGSGDEVGAVDFDYRWNAQDTRVTDVAYAVEARGTDRALVTVTFKNFGEPGRTFYDMCRRQPDGVWRILDVRSNDQPDGSVRAMLKLGPTSEATVC